MLLIGLQDLLMVVLMLGRENRLGLLELDHNPMKVLMVDFWLLWRYDKVLYFSNGR